MITQIQQNEKEIERGKTPSLEFRSAECLVGDHIEINKTDICTQRGGEKKFHIEIMQEGMKKLRFLTFVRSSLTQSASVIFFLAVEACDSHHHSMVGVVLSKKTHDTAQ